MSRYIKGMARNQVVMVLQTLDEQIEEDNEIRIIDAFVDSLDMKELGFVRAETKDVGTLGYDPRDMLKLYLYGYKRNLRSARKLEEACKINIEVMWLMKGLKPNFRSIADFRKENSEAFKKVFVEFNVVCKNMGLISGKISQDGVKIKAVNSKDKNYTLNKIDDRINRLVEKIDGYEKELEENDKTEEEKLVDIETMKKQKEEYKKEVEGKVEELIKRKEKNEQIKEEVETSGDKQKSMTDSDSKLMKNNGKSDVAYNNQVGVDVETHIISGYEVSNDPADIGKINVLEEKTQEEIGVDKIEEEKLVDIETMKKQKEEYKKEVEGTLEELRKRKEKYEQIREEIETSGNKQKSMTDPDSKLMKNNGKFDVAYNNQVGVDVETHIISGYEVSNNPADIGKINVLGEKIQKEIGVEIITDVTDKGYNDRSDMIKSLENGIIPQVTPQEDKDVIELETEYEENEISEETRKSRNKEDIKKCLRAGVIPEAYEGKIEKIEVVEKEEVVVLEKGEEKNYPQGDLRDYAMKNKCFVRDIQTDRVYCGQGEILRPKSKHKDGKKYCNKQGCKACKNPCTEAAFKEVVFKEGQITVGDKNRKRTRNKTEKREVKRVVISLKLDKELLSLRMGTSEHPHGTMKRWDSFDYFLLRGKEKVEGELGLYYCAVNIRRAIKLKGMETVLEEIRKYGEEKDKRGRFYLGLFMKKIKIVIFSHFCTLNYP